MAHKFYQQWYLNSANRSYHTIYLAETGPIFLVTLGFEPPGRVTAAGSAHGVAPPRRRAFLWRLVLAVTTTLPKSAIASVGGLPARRVLTLRPVLARVVLGAHTLALWPDGS